MLNVSRHLPQFRTLETARQKRRFSVSHAAWPRGAFHPTLFLLSHTFLGWQRSVLWSKGFADTVREIHSQVAFKQGCVKSRGDLITTFPLFRPDRAWAPTAEPHRQRYGALPPVGQRHVSQQSPSADIKFDFKFSNLSGSLSYWRRSATPGCRPSCRRCS